MACPGISSLQTSHSSLFRRHIWAFSICLLSLFNLWRHPCYRKRAYKVGSPWHTRYVQCCCRVKQRFFHTLLVSRASDALVVVYSMRPFHLSGSILHVHSSLPSIALGFNIFVWLVRTLLHVYSDTAAGGRMHPRGRACYPHSGTLCSRTRCLSDH